MCGIAGIIHKGAKANVGGELTAMLQSLRHRGPDSTGFALYKQSASNGQFIMRFKVAEQEDLASGFDIHDTIARRKDAVDSRLQELGANVTLKEDATEYAQRYTFSFDGDLKKLIDFVEDVDDVEILSVRSRAHTPSGTREWQPNPTWTFARPIRTGRIRSVTSRWSTTAS